MKKMFKLILLGMFGVLLVACGANTSEQDTETTETTETETASSEGSIGFSISTLNNPFFVSMADGAESKAQELGIKLTVVDAGNDPAKQVTDIEDLITSRIDVLIVNPEDSASVGPAVNNAIEQGIKVIAVDRVVEGAEIDTYIGTDNVLAGEQVGEYMLEILEEDDEIAILEGIPGASSAIDRHQGFMNALEGNVNIVASQTANYDRAEGMTVTENLLQANPNIKAIIAANDEMALGAIEAISGSGRTPGEDVLVTGFDAGDDAKEAVKNGSMLFTVEQQTVLMGELAVETALQMIDGEEVDSELPIEVTLLDIAALED